jgi:hypothetical protein
LVNLDEHTTLLRDADQICFVDVDDTVKPTYGYAIRAPTTATPA